MKLQQRSRKFKILNTRRQAVSVGLMPLLLFSSSLASAAETSLASAAPAGHSAAMRPGFQRSAIVPIGSSRLDLRSMVANISLDPSTLKGADSVVIKVGAGSREFVPGSLVTPGELLAIGQYISSGMQSIVLRANGSVASGSVSLDLLHDTMAGLKVSDLIIPRQVIAFDDVSSGPAFQITGNLINYGSIYTGTSAKVDGAQASLSALNISNQPGSLISSVIPHTSLPAFAGLLSVSNLSLSALDSISNQGRIVSAGILNLTAGNSIINALPAGLNGPRPTLEAVNSVNLNVGTGSLINAGLILSQAGNINISNLASTSNVNIIGTGGTFQALLGDINIRSQLYSGLGNVNITGGDFLSRNLNIYSGSGDVEALVGQITGNLNTVAAIQHFSANTSVLNLGDNCISGDPTYVNFGGDININGVVSNGADANLAIIAAGNITATGPGALIDTHSTTGKAGNVYIIAGANLSDNGTAGGGNSPAGITLPGVYDITTGTVSVNFDLVGKGGDVDLSAVSGNPVINSSSSGGAGGNVTILAFTGSGGGGHVKVASTSGINSSSSFAGANAGDVSVIAAANDANAISLGTINCNSGAGVAGGMVTLITAKPSSWYSAQVNFDKAGVPSGGTINTYYPSYTITNVSAGVSLEGLSGAREIQVKSGGDITLNSDIALPSGTVGLNSSSGTITTKVVDASGLGGVGDAASGGGGGPILIQSGVDDIVTGALRSFGGGGAGSSNGGFWGGGGASGGTITVTTPASITINGEINTSGGGGGAYGVGGGWGGVINVNAGGTLSIDGPVLSASGGDASASSGGGSFGGGGGARFSTGGTGGGGFYGGGSTGTGILDLSGAGGGGIAGGGNAGSGGLPGEYGKGGGGALFGVGGTDASNAGQPGRNGEVYLTGTTITVAKTVGTGFSGAFASSPFAGVSIVGSNITFKNASALSIAGDTQSSGGTISYCVSSPSSPVVVYGPAGRTVYLDFPNAGAITVPQINYKSYGYAVSVNALLGQDININPVTFASSGGFIANTTGNIYSAGATALNNSDTFNLSGNAGVTVTGDISLPSGNVSLTSKAGAINTANIDVSGIGGVSKYVGANGGGSIAIQTYASGGAGDITTGYLRSYGGGGAGVYYPEYWGPGGANGGTITVNAAAGSVTINGDVNTSGGGGGAAQGGGGTGGTINLSAAASLVVNGPVLSAGGGDASGSSGGGSFGGGGGARGSVGGAGGGGLYGGGSTGNGVLDVSGADGGGITGGGKGGDGGTPGQYGMGAGGAVFGVGGNGAPNAGQSGRNGSVILGGSNITVSKTIGTGFSGAFASSPFASDSIVGGSITFNNASVLNIAGDTQTSGGTITYSMNTPTSKVVLYGPPSTVNINFPNAGLITVPQLENKSPNFTVNVNGLAGQNININTLSFVQPGSFYASTSGKIFSAGAVELNTSNNVFNLSGDAGVYLTGDVKLASGAVNLTSNLGAIQAANIDVSGKGGTNAAGGSSGGSINLRTYAGPGVGDIVTGYLRAYGGGGSGVNSPDFWGPGGGSGGSITVTASAASVTINGDVNNSGGGAGAAYAGGGYGGTININAATTLIIDGPVLSAGGGDASNYSGGGSFGGGGGSRAQTGGGGGGGFYGGGSTGTGPLDLLGAGGGGINGGGVAGSGGLPGSYGTGGGGALFGVGGTGAGNAGQSGRNGSITLAGTSITVGKTIGTGFAGAFASSPFADLSIAGGNISFNNASVLTIAGDTQSSGGTITYSMNAPTSKVVLYGAPNTVYLNFPNAGAITIPQIEFKSSSFTARVNGLAGQNINIGTVSYSQYGAFYASTSGKISSAGALELNSVGNTFNLSGDAGITISGDIRMASGVVALTSNLGGIHTAGIDVSGKGGVNAAAGGNGGSITLSTYAGVGTGDIVTGYMRSFGGGGSGVNSPDFWAPPGGAGGSITVTASAGAVNVNGDVNSSGGGGGAAYGGGGTGGSISINAGATLIVDGPVLSAGGGDGNNYSGGGSFGGGGGARYSTGGGGGGGFYGGGSTGSGPLDITGGGGGGIAGGGIAGDGGVAGSFGTGGGGAAFGVGGAGAGDAGQSGRSGAITLGGSSITVAKNIGTAFSGAFAASPFADVAIAGSNITFNNATSLTIAGDTQSTGGTITYSMNSPSSKVVAYGPSSQTIYLNFPNAGIITVPEVVYKASNDTVRVNALVNQDINIGVIQFNQAGAFFANTTGTISAAGTNSSSAAGSTFNLSADNGVTLTGDLRLASASVTLTSNLGSITTKNIDVSGLGGAVSQAGGAAAGSISLQTYAPAAGITTGYLHAYGGGGAGASSSQFWGPSGGSGGTVTLKAGTGAVTVQGDINVSGGGGGAYYGPGGSGGAVNVTSTGAVTIDGPVLAAGGGDGGSTSGGGSFGGGGGARGNTGGGGGGGFYGGGSTGTWFTDTSGGLGGGFLGAGAAGDGGAAGAYGVGGGANGGVFGVGGTDASSAAQSGRNGSISLSGTSITVSKTIETGYGAQMASSPFAKSSIVASNISLLNTGTTSIAGDIQSSGGTFSFASSSLPNKIVLYGQAGMSLNLDYTGSGNLNLAQFEFMVPSATVSLVTAANQNINVGTLTFNKAGSFNVTTGGDISFAGVSSTAASSAVNLKGQLGINVSGDIILPSGTVSLITQGAISTKNINVSGLGGAGATSLYAGGGAGGNGGTISLQAGADINTSYLRAFGGGGGGGSSTYGGTGGSGGTINANTSGGNIAVSGDINVSGGGAGGYANAGGSGGNVTLSASNKLTVDGPVLAAGGGNAGWTGAGAFGGGGGSAAGGNAGAGGGGFYGGGSGTNAGILAGSGGGIFGGGAAGDGGTAGSFGTGGGGTAFGIGGADSNTVAQINNNGSISLSGSSITVSKTIGSAFGGALSASPFADSSLVAGNISLLNASSSSLAGGIQSSGGTLSFSSNPGTSKIVLYGPAGQTVNLDYLSPTGVVTVPQLVVNVSSGRFVLNVATSQDVTMNGMSINANASSANLTVNTGGLISFNGVNTTALYGALNLNGSSGVTISGAVQLPSGSVTLASSSGKVATSNIDLSGLGGIGVPSGQGQAGGNGGTLSITALSDVQTGYLRSYGGGGGGGSGYYGGSGGSGGSIGVSSSAGTVKVLGDINVSGGGAGAFYNGGGAAGAINVSASSDLQIDGPVLAAGGGASGYYSGGGSFGGGGGAVSSSASGGGGGFYGGGSAGASGVRGGGGGGMLAGGAAGDFGLAGSLGSGGGGAVFGVAGGSDSNNAGVTGGGSITLSGNTVSVTKTIGTAYGPSTSASPNPFTTSPFAKYSIFAGVGGSVNITSPGASGPGSAAYFADADFSSNSKTNSADIKSGFFGVGFVTAANGVGTAGGINAGNSIMINGNAAPSSDINNIIFTSGVSGGSVTIMEGGSPRAINAGTLITPAEWVAIMQSASGTQNLILNASGQASGGSLIITDGNFPTTNSGKFASLLVPASVTANVLTTTLLPVTDKATINGTLNFNALSSGIAGGLSTVNGITSGGSGQLNVLSNGQLSLNATKGDLGSSGLPLNVNAGKLIISSAGSAYINNSSSSPVLLGASSADNFSLTAAAGIVSDGNSTFTGALTLKADSITVFSGNTLTGKSITFTGLTVNGTKGAGTNMNLLNNGDLIATAGNIEIDSASGQDLVVGGDGTGKFYASDSNRINIIASNNSLAKVYPSLYFNASQGFIFNGTSPAGTVNLTANGSMSSSVTLEANVTLDFPTDNSTVNVNTCNIVLNGSGGSQGKFDLHGNPGSQLIFNCPFKGTIANSTGPLDLNGMSLQFSGAKLALLSAGDIVNTGAAATLDLSNASGDGGALVMIAGFKFSPATSGTIGPNGVLYTLNADPNSGSGSILLGQSGHEVNVDTSGSGAGGNMLAVAHGGSVELGTVTTSGGSGTSGNVTVMGNGVKIVGISTAASDLDKSGTVTISSGVVTQTGALPVQISGGLVIQGTFQVASTDLGGKVDLGTVNAGRASIAVSTNGSAGLITVKGAPVAHKLSLLAGTGIINIAGVGNSLTVVPDLSGNGGAIDLSAANVLTATPSSPLVMNALGSGMDTGGAVTYTRNDSSPFTLNSSVLQVNASGKNGGTFAFSTAGNLTVTPSALMLNLGPNSGSGGKGASMTFKAGVPIGSLPAASSTLLVDGNLSANGDGSGAAGSIFLSSNNASTFLLGEKSTSKATNAVRGNLSFTGAPGTGSLTIVNSGGGITAGAQLLDMGSISLSTLGSSAGTITLGKSTGTALSKTIDLSTGGSGKIVSAGTIQAANVNLNTGAAGISLKVNTGKLTANSSGVVNVTNLGTSALTLGASSATGATATFTISTAGDISSGNISAGKGITLKTTAKNGAISLNGNLLTTQTGASITMATTGTGLFTASAGSISSDKVSITSAAGITLNAGVTAPVSLTLSAVKGDITVGSAPLTSANGTIAITALTNITSSAPISALKSVALTTTATSGVLRSSGNIVASNGTVMLKSGASAAVNAIDTSGADISAAKSVTFSAVKGGVIAGSIGKVQAADKVIVTSFNNITLGDQINGLTGITVSSSSTLASTGNITISGGMNLSSPNGVITVTSNGSSKIIDKAAASSITGASITFNSAADLLMDASMSASKALTLNSKAGSISLGNASKLSASAGTVAITAMNNLFANGSISADKSVTLKTTLGNPANSMSVGNVSVANGPININSFGGPLSVLPGSTIQVGSPSAKASTGSITIADSNPVSGASIDIGAGSTIATYVAIPSKTNGTISVFIGKAPSAPVVGSNTTAITVSGSSGTAYWGANGIDPASTGTISLQGANVIFNTGDLPAQSIKVNSTTFIADPPIVAAHLTTKAVIAQPVTFAPAAGPITSAHVLTRDNRPMYTGTQALPNLYVHPTTADDAIVSSGSYVYNLNTSTADSRGVVKTASSLLASNRFSLDANREFNTDVGNTSVGADATTGVNTCVEADASVGASARVDANAITFENSSAIAKFASTAFGVESLAFCTDAEPAAFSNVHALPLRSITTLTEGSVLLAPLHDVQVVTPVGRVFLKANTLVLVSASRDTLAVHNFDDHSKTGVTVESCGHTMLLSPGRHVTVSTDNSEFAKLNLMPEIAHRKLMRRALENGMWVHTSEFAIPTAIRAVKPLSEIVASKDPAARKISARLAKTAAILMIMNGNRDVYKMYTDPDNIHEISAYANVSR